MFWTIFWIAIFIIPAFWLASLVLQLIFWVFIAIIGGIIMGISKIIKAIRSK